MSRAIEGCKSHSGRKENCPDIITFHRFLKDEEYKNEWIRRVARKNWTWKTHSHLCSKHFTLESFLPNKSIKWRRLKENALPTLYLSYSEPMATEELGCMDVEAEQAQFPTDATAGASSHYTSTSIISKDSMVSKLNLYEYEFYRGRCDAETAQRINNVYGAGVAKENTVRFWFQPFRSGNFDLQNKPRGRPETKMNNEELKAIVEADPSQTTSKLAVGFGVNDKTALIH